jgi:hypothetical protein
MIMTTFRGHHVRHFSHCAIRRRGLASISWAGCGVTGHNNRFTTAIDRQ